MTFKGRLTPLLRDSILTTYGRLNISLFRDILSSARQGAAVSAGRTDST